MSVSRLKDFLIGTERPQGDCGMSGMTKSQTFHLRTLTTDKSALSTHILVKASGIEINVPFLVIVFKNFTEGAYGRWVLSWPKAWREKTAFTKLRRSREKFEGILRHPRKMRAESRLTSQLQPFMVPWIFVSTFAWLYLTSGCILGSLSNATRPQPEDGYQGR